MIRPWFGLDAEFAVVKLRDLMQRRHLRLAADIVNAAVLDETASDARGHRHRAPAVAVAVVVKAKGLAGCNSTPARRITSCGTRRGRGPRWCI